VAQPHYPTNNVPIEDVRLERQAASLLAQIRWRDSIYCPRCRAKSLIRHSSYWGFQWYLCNDFGRTFNGKARFLNTQ
jgi:transposase